MPMKSAIRKVTPPFLVRQYRQFRRLYEQRRDRQRTTEQVFTEIYAKKRWGAGLHTHEDFCSGTGSADESIVSAYIASITDIASREGFRGLTFVDLGCGDFRVGRRLLPLCSRYIGVDIVKSLVDRNARTYGNETTRFVHLDIVNDPLPDGDVCFVRQVMQHLSNEQVARLLDHLRKYRWVVITEHLPSDSDSIVPNLDKPHGSDIRLDDNSGVFLSEPPFSVPSDRLTLVLERPGAQRDGDRGVIRTFLYKPAH